MICYLFANAKDVYNDSHLTFSMLQHCIEEYRRKYEMIFQEWRKGYVFASYDTISVLKNTTPFNSCTEETKENTVREIFGFEIIFADDIPFGIVDIR